MNYEEFKCTIKERIKDYLPRKYSDWEVEEINFLKVNEKNEGFTVVNPKVEERGTASIVYYDMLFNLYKMGHPLEELLKNVAELIQAGDDFAKEELEGINVNDYSECKDKVIIEVINNEVNKELLQTLVSRDYLIDLAVVYRLDLGNQKSALITKSLFEEWDITEEELFGDAYRNTPIQSEFVLKGTNHHQGLPDDLLVLTNERCLFGATAMIYPEKLKEAAEILGGDFYLLPSSIHEMFLIDVDGRDVEGLKDFVKFTNTILVPPDEFLSNNVYMYHQKTGEVRVA